MMKETPASALPTPLTTVFETASPTTRQTIALMRENVFQFIVFAL